MSQSVSQPKRQPTCPWPLHPSWLRPIIGALPRGSSWKERFHTDPATRLRFFRRLYKFYNHPLMRLLPANRECAKIIAEHIEDHERLFAETQAESAGGQSTPQQNDPQQNDPQQNDPQQKDPQQDEPQPNGSQQRHTSYDRQGRANGKQRYTSTGRQSRASGRPRHSTDTYATGRRNQMSDNHDTGQQAAKFYLRNQAGTSRRFQRDKSLAELSSRRRSQSPSSMVCEPPSSRHPQYRRGDAERSTGTQYNYKQPSKAEKEKEFDAFKTRRQRQINSEGCYLNERLSPTVKSLSSKDAAVRPSRPPSRTFQTSNAGQHLKFVTPAVPDRNDDYPSRSRSRRHSCESARSIIAPKSSAQDSMSLSSMKATVGRRSSMIEE